MREISGMEANLLSKDNLELLNAQKDTGSKVGKTRVKAEASTLQEAVQVLFDFIERELVVPAAKQATLAAMQAKVRGFVRQTMIASRTVRPERAQKRVVVVSPMDSEDELSEAVSSFEATPAFKKAQPPQKPMMITRSQRKCRSNGRKRTARQANVEAAESDVAEDDSSNTVRPVRSTKKRRLN